MEINRAVVIVKPRQPYVDWANSCDDDDVKTSFASLRRDSSAYLVPPYDMDVEHKPVIPLAAESTDFSWKSIGRLGLVK